MDKHIEQSSSVIFLEYGSRDEASQALAAEIAETIRSALDRDGEAAVVVSGGTSPVAFFHALREMPLNWGNVTLLPSDERNVPAGHSDRNDAMIEREFLVGPAADARLLGMLPRGNENDPCLDNDSRIHFDAVILGMGTDGHTASLFPDSPDIEQDLSSNRNVVNVDVPRLDAGRISLTPAALLNSSRIDLLFFGDDKRSVYEQAMAPGPVSELPVRAILHQDRVPVRVFWAP